ASWRIQACRSSRISGSRISMQVKLLNSLTSPPRSSFSEVPAHPYGRSHSHTDRRSPTRAPARNAKRRAHCDVSPSVPCCLTASGHEFNVGHRSTRRIYVRIVKGGVMALGLGSARRLILVLVSV